MQANERNTLEMITEAAKEEFRLKGFKDANLRKIASRAGLTTGALYRYFASKEELFGALVDDAYCGIIGMYREMLEDFQKLTPEEQMTDMMAYTMKTVDGMVDFVYENKDAMKLILCSSEGTEYNDLVHEMAKLDSDATDLFRDSHVEGYSPDTVNERVQHMLTSGMFSMFFELIIHDAPKDEAEKCVKILLEFYHAGWMEIMGL